MLNELIGMPLLWHVQKQKGSNNTRKRAEKLAVVNNANQVSPLDVTAILENNVCELVQQATQIR